MELPESLLWVGAWYSVGALDWPDKLHLAMSSTEPDRQVVDTAAAAAMDCDADTHGRTSGGPGEPALPAGAAPEGSPARTSPVIEMVDEEDLELLNYEPSTGDGRRVRPRLGEHNEPAAIDNLTGLPLLQAAQQQHDQAVLMQQRVAEAMADSGAGVGFGHGGGGGRGGGGGNLTGLPLLQAAQEQHDQAVLVQQRVADAMADSGKGVGFGLGGGGGRGGGGGGGGRGGGGGGRGDGAGRGGGAEGAGVPVAGKGMPPPQQPNGDGNGKGSGKGKGVFVNGSPGKGKGAFANVPGKGAKGSKGGGRGGHGGRGVGGDAPASLHADMTAGPDGAQVRRLSD